MSNLRLIARLDVKGSKLIKAINLEGVRVVGDPQEASQRYYEQGVDEILYMDAVASLYGRNSLAELVKHTAEDVFIPITVGGGLRSIDDVRNMLRTGADKVAINTAATYNPDLITEVANQFGSQCMVLSIEAKQSDNGKWEAYRDGGREHTGLDVLEWAIRGMELGAGEILLTSVDNEGTRKGFDIELTRTISSAVSIPVIASGGMGTFDHLVQVVQEGCADAVSMADILHYKRSDISEIRRQALACNLPVRKL